MEELKGSWALIGRSITLALARRGVSTIGVARTERDLLNLKLEVERLGASFIGVQADLTASGAVEDIYHKIEALNLKPALRVVVLNAATVAAGPFSQFPLQVQENIVALNILVPLRLVSRLLPLLQQNRRSYVVSISSQGALLPVPWMATYAASKAFLHQFSLALSGEFKDSGIHFVTAIPAHTETGAFDAIGVPTNIKSEFPRGRSPDEIADVIVKNLSIDPPCFISNVQGLRFFRAFVGLAPLAFLIKSAGRMFKSFKTSAFYSKKS